MNTTGSRTRDPGYWTSLYQQGPDGDLKQDPGDGHNFEPERAGKTGEPGVARPGSPPRRFEDMSYREATSLVDALDQYAEQRLTEARALQAQAEQAIQDAKRTEQSATYLRDDLECRPADQPEPDAGAQAGQYEATTWTPAAAHEWLTGAGRRHEWKDISPDQKECGSCQTVATRQYDPETGTLSVDFLIPGQAEPPQQAPLCSDVMAGRSEAGHEAG